MSTRRSGIGANNIGPLWCSLACASVLLASCGSVPRTEDAGDVAKDRWIDLTARAPSVESATIIVKRSTVFTQSFCNVRIYLNGKPVVDVSTGERALLAVLPGSHIVGADMPSNVCPARMREVSIDLAPRKQAAFIIDVSPVDGTFIFQQSGR